MPSRLIRDFIRQGARVSQIWDFYCLVQRGEVIEHSKVIKNGKILASLREYLDYDLGSNGLTIFNGQRGMNGKESSRIFRLKMAFVADSYPKPKDIISLDCNRQDKFIGGVTKAFVKAFANHVIGSAVIYTLHGKGATIVYLALTILLDNNISFIGLFTSNNRLTEAFRIAGLMVGAYVVEFLHGICCESFEQYYDLIEISSRRSIRYVNMYPGLPQPKSIARHILSYKGNVVCYVNERVWVRKAGQGYRFDIAVVGNNTLDREYSESDAFRCEANLVEWAQKIRECLIHIKKASNKLK